MAVLRITTEEGSARQEELCDAVVVGRSPQCQIRVRDDDVSRQHCRIEPSQEGWIVIDLGSKNGTFVGSDRVDRHVLKDGDEMRIGPATLKFIADALSVSAADLEEEAENVLRDDAPSDETAAGIKVGRKEEEHKSPDAPDDVPLPATSVLKTRNGDPASAGADSPPAPLKVDQVGATPPAAAAPTIVAAVEKGPAARRGGKRNLWDLANASVPPPSTDGDAKPVDSSKLLGLELRGKSRTDRDGLGQEKKEESPKWYRRRIPAPFFIAVTVVLIALLVWRLYVFFTT